MLGFSVFLKDFSVSTHESYIQKMSESGFGSIFTSLHIPEDNHSTYKNLLQDLGSLAKKYHLELFADISPKSLESLGFTWDSASELTKWGVTGLRVDYGVPEQTMAQLSQDMRIALNASTLTSKTIQLLEEHGMEFSSVEAWHNYYPRPETGLNLADFNEKNAMLKQVGLSVMAFIPGDAEKRGPLYEGLPTLEDHRGQTTFASFLDLQHNPYVDKILIGDPAVSDASLQQFAAYEQGVILLRAKTITQDKEIIKSLSSPHTNRQDAARDVVRSEESRLYGQIGARPAKANNTVDRNMGAITMDNEKYGRYQGEIQITKRDLPADDKVNVIGQVIEQDLPLLSYIKGGVKFQIYWVD